MPCRATEHSEAVMDSRAFRKNPRFQGFRYWLPEVAAGWPFFDPEAEAIIHQIEPERMTQRGNDWASLGPDARR